LIHWSVAFTCETLGVEKYTTAGIAFGVIALVILVIHRSDRTEMFKGVNWQKDAEVTLAIFAGLSIVLGSSSILSLPVNLVLMYSLVWYIRKRTGGDKTKTILTRDDVKVGSPF